MADELTVGRVVLFAIGLLIALWVLGTLAQGILISTSFTARKIWFFTWLWQRFALGLVVGLVIGYVGALAMSRRRALS